MTFEELATLRQEDFVDVDGSPNPLPSPESIEAARVIHAAVMASGPIPEGGEVEVDADVNGGTAVTMWGPMGERVWFCIRQDGSHHVILHGTDQPARGLAPATLVDHVAEARRYMGWP